MSITTLDEASVEFLECARYGEAEDLLACLAFGVDVNYKDPAGNTALHRAAANGELECIRILKSHNIIFCENQSGNTPLHWAVQNQKVDATKYLLENFEAADVLKQNAAGRSALTDAFQTGNTDLIEACLTHHSSSEDKLLDKFSSSDVKLTEGDESEESPPSVVHEFSLSAAEEHRGRTITIRELALTNADNPFGTDTAPEDDTTGLAIWAASVLLSRYALQLGPSLFKDKVVIELGCGCAIPGITVAAYLGPKSVYVTDINAASLDNARFNVALNKVGRFEGEGDGESAGVVEVCRVNWLEPESFPPEPADIILGSDLVYDDKILQILVPAIIAMLAPHGCLLYSCLASERAGMDDLVPALAEAGLVLVEQMYCPDSYYDNPLTSGDGDQYVLHFYEMSSKKPHYLFRFQRIIS